MKMLHSATILLICYSFAVGVNSCERCEHSKAVSAVRNLKTYVPVDPKKQSNVPSHQLYTTKRYLEEEEETVGEEAFEGQYDVGDEDRSSDSEQLRSLKASYVPRIPIEIPIVTKQVYSYRPVAHTPYVVDGKKGRYLAEEESETYEDELFDEREDTTEVEQHEEAVEERHLKSYVPSKGVPMTTTKTVYRPVQKTVYRLVTKKVHASTSKKGRWLAEDDDGVEEDHHFHYDDIQGVIEAEEDPESELEADSRMLKEYTASKSYAPIYTARVVPVSMKVYRPIISKKSSYRPTSGKMYRYLGEVDAKTIDAQ